MLAFAKQHGPVAVIALFLAWAMASRSEVAHSKLIDAVNTQAIINGQLLVEIGRSVYLQRVACQNSAATPEAQRRCLKDSDE